MMSTHIPPEGKELRIEGLVNAQNPLSTKSSGGKRPLKIRNSGVKSEVSESSDPGRTFKSNMIRQASFKTGQRNLARHVPLAHPIGTEMSDELVK